jgi:2'-5' RNA ligase
MNDGRISASQVEMDPLPITKDRTGVRTFVAVPLPSDLQIAMHLAAHSLSARLPDVKWSRKAENLHVTLRFLGQVDGALLGLFAAALSEELGARPGFEIGLRGLGVAEDGGQAHVRRPFRAHVTVGRTLRHARSGVDALAALEPWSDRAFGGVSVREIHVYESITGGDASTYVLRGKALLQPC